MKQNPCRYCRLSIEYNGKHYQGFNPECYNCENLKKHKEYLISKRKFIAGDPITDIQELLKQEWVIFNEKAKHIEVIKHNQLSVVLGWIEHKMLRYAIRK